MSAPDKSDVRKPRRTGARRRVQRARPWLLWLFLVFVTALAIGQFGVHPTYDFPSPEPFHGDRWYNPYATPASMRLRACFHAHATGWGGTTNASNSNSEVHAAYRKLGYQVVGISNYQSIRPQVDEDTVFLPVYEHGFGLGQQHQTVIGAPGVLWFDYLFGQNLHQMQHVIDLLRDQGAFVIANHPNKSQGYSEEDLGLLSGVRGVEIRSRFAKAVEYWDAALTAGKPLWGFCSDDSHDLSRPWHIASGWVEIDVTEPTPDAVRDALELGRFTSIWAKSRGAPNGLRSLVIEGDVLKLSLVRKADWIRVVRNDGAISEIVRAKHELEIPLHPEDTYVRIHVNTANTDLFLNPVFRYSGEDPFMVAQASVLSGPTLVRRSLAGLYGLFILSVGFWIARDQRRSAPSGEHDVAVVATDDNNRAAMSDPAEVPLGRDRHLQS